MDYLLGVRYTEAMKMYTLPELARELGLARQSVWEQVQRAAYRGSVPKPDAWTMAGRPLWKASTVKTVSTGKSAQGLKSVVPPS